MKDKKNATPPASHPVSSATVTRRQFLKRMGVLGGGIVIYAAVGDPLSRAQQPADFNALLRIGADGRVTCFTGKIEMGQGVVTSLAQMLANHIIGGKRKSVV